MPSIAAAALGNTVIPVASGFDEPKMAVSQGWGKGCNDEAKGTW